MFFMTYKNNNSYGHYMSTKEYSIFTRKSKIINDFFNWNIEKQKLINESSTTLNLKIIGL